MTEPASSPVPDFFPDALPKFKIGQVVRHRRYGYRAVVVDFDVACQADEAWYRSNRTQPRRDQAWYHLLVDSVEATTYAAEENLEDDPGDQRIEHMLVDRFFDGFEGGVYRRNDERWPGWR